MSGASAPSRKTVALSWLPFVFVPLVAWSKDAAVVVLALAVLFILFQPEARRAALSRTHLLSPAGLIAVAFILWSAAALIWAPVVAGSAWAKAIMVMLLTVVLAQGITGLPLRWLPHAAKAVFVSAVALLVLLLVERITGGFLIGLNRTGDAPERLFNIMSAGLAFLCCLSYPAALLMRNRSGSWRIAGPFVAAVFLVSLTYRMDAAPFAIAAGFIAFLVVTIGKRAGFILVMTGLALVAFSWGGFATEAVQFHTQGWLTEHATSNWSLRVEIWNRVTQLILEKPVLGYGFDTARILGQPPVGQRLDAMPGDGIAVAFMHPHNGMLQVWLELGLIGVLLLFAWMALAVRGMMRVVTDTTTLAIIAATTSTAAVFWLVSFGIWQGWWLAALGLTLSAVVLGMRSSRHARDL